ncbi:MAG: DUF3810 domain-containing protein [Phaeodactylibacter sp.]|nr:DUF3810 domain-containing protein [Phaeodactylibacter sp.]MCB9301100.1 DUF3810 domain-containing protein [Lewinellaceae bacterium]
MHKLKTKLIWIALGLGAVALRALFSGYPEVVEQYYSQAFFPVIRWSIDYLLAWFPVPLVYPFLLLLFLLTIRQVRLWWKRTYANFWYKSLDAALGIGASLSGVVFFFLFMWGFNYGRIPLENQLGLELTPLSLKELKAELNHETAQIKRLRNLIPGATTEPISNNMLPASMESLLRGEVEQLLDSHGYPTVGRVRGMYVYPKGIFLRFSSSGLYFPWTGEGHVDAGLHSLQKPFVMAHELSHGYGFGDEGTCNFLAFLSCIQSKDPVIAYSGHLNYWRTLAANYRYYEPEKYREFRESLPLGIQSDLDAINEVLLRYPDFMPHLRYVAYDAYLKAQGIEEGMLNYDRVIMMAHAWRLSQRI